MTKKQQGFTLIELLVVIAILALLTSIVLVSIRTATSKARDAKRIEEISQIRTAVEIYYSKYGYYPQVNNQELANGWSDLLDIFKTEGLISIFPENKSKSKSNPLSNFLFPKAQATLATACPQNIKPQDPLCECKTPNEVPPDGGIISHTYGYYVGQGDQSYRIRAQLENNNSVLQNSLTGDFVYGSDDGCDTSQLYYCVGNGAYIP